MRTSEDFTAIGNLRERVRLLMNDGAWRTLAEIQSVVQGSEAGVSARLRDLRKPQYGCAKVERRIRKGRLREYRVCAYPQCKRCGHGEQEHHPDQESDLPDPCQVRGCACFRYQDDSIQGEP